MAHGQCITVKLIVVKVQAISSVPQVGNHYESINCWDEKIIIKMSPYYFYTNLKTFHSFLQQT